MSIIYDALRKTQAKIDVNIEEKPKVNKNLKKNLAAILIFVIILTAFFYSNKLFFGFKNAGDNQLIQDKQDSKKAIPVTPGLYGSLKDVIKNDSFVLSGIACDEKNTWAVINNKILKEGDFINRAQITKISQDEVELSLGEDKKLVLSAKQ